MTNKKAEHVSAFIKFFLATPMFLWLAHEILERVEATELMWFIYWAYIPIILVAILLAAVAAD